MLASLVLMLLAGAGEKPRVVVAGVTSFDASTAKRAAELEELALTELSRSGRLEVIGRSDVTTLLGIERQKELLGCAQESACMAEIGAALGAPYLVAGSVGSSGTLLRVDLKLVQVATSKVIARVGEVVERDRDWYTVTTAMFGRLEAAVPGVAAPAAAMTTGRAVWPFFIAGAGALAGAAGGVLMGVAAGSASQSLADGRGRVLTAPEVNARFDDAVTMHTVGVGLVIGGAAVAATGLVFVIVTGASTPPPVAISPIAGGAQLTLQGTF